MADPTHTNFAALNRHLLGTGTRYCQVEEPIFIDHVGRECAVISRYLTIEEFKVLCDKYFIYLYEILNVEDMPGKYAFKYYQLEDEQVP